MELFKAHRQWAERPADERFATLQELYNVTKDYADKAREKNVPVSDIRTEASSGDVQLVGKAGVPAGLTHWAFGQLCARVGAPASYLRELPATLATQNLNHGLANYADKHDTANLMFHTTNGDMLLRAFTSEKYARIWNWEVAERLLGLESLGWEPARPDMRWDGGDASRCQSCDGTGTAMDKETYYADNPSVDGRCKTCKGTGQALPALYASDHDLFAFVRNCSVVIRETNEDGTGTGNPDGLQRGVIVENSEVGASALKLTRFLYRCMCGNHIIWGASRVVDFAIRHVGDTVRERFGQYTAEIRRYAESSASDDEAVISRARTVRIGETKDAVLDKLFGMRSLSLSRKILDAGYMANVPGQDGDPRTVWGMVQGLTRHSQTIPYADGRTTIDRAAGKILEAVF